MHVCVCMHMSMCACTFLFNQFAGALNFLQHTWSQTPGRYIVPHSPDTQSALIVRAISKFSVSLPSLISVHLQSCQLYTIGCVSAYNR